MHWNSKIFLQNLRKVLKNRTKNIKSIKKIVVKCSSIFIEQSFYHKQGNKVSKTQWAIEYECI